MYKLLIVDDEYEIRVGLANYFPWDSVGFVVIGTCENGQQALDFLSQNIPQVILCDVEMPTMNVPVFCGRSTRKSNWCF